MNPSESPRMHSARALGDDWTLLPAWMPVPGHGVLAVNSFLLGGSEPLLVDTGLAALGDDWFHQLGQVVDPDDLRWIWISHADADHVGNLAELLVRSPKATVLTSFLGMGKLAMAGIDPVRMQVIEPGQEVEVGERRLLPIRPPYYDAPETLGLWEADTGTLFAADCFGALLPEAVENAEDAGATTLSEGLVGWSAIDAPWLGQADPKRLGATLNRFARLGPERLLSGHLPPSAGGLQTLAPIVHDAWCRGGSEARDPFHIEALLESLPTTAGREGMAS